MLSFEFDFHHNITCMIIAFIITLSDNKTPYLLCLSGQKHDKDEEKRLIDGMVSFQSRILIVYSYIYCFAFKCII